jgi:hypothetical protein
MISDTSTGKVWPQALPATASSVAITRAARILVVLLDILITVVPLSPSMIEQAKT